LIIVSGDYKNPREQAGTAAYSATNGKSWVVPKDLPHGYRSALAVLGAQIFIAVGPNGSDVSLEIDADWRALSWPPRIAIAGYGHSAWAVGPGGRRCLSPESRAGMNSAPAAHSFALRQRNADEGALASVVLARVG